MRSRAKVDFNILHGNELHEISVLVLRKKYKEMVEIAKIKNREVFNLKNKINELNEKARQEIIQIREKKREALKKHKKEVRLAAKKQGYEKGVSLNLRVRRKEIFKEGLQKGFDKRDNQIKETRVGLEIKRSAKIADISRACIMVNKLFSTLGIMPEYVALILLMGQYDAFVFSDLKESFERLEGDLFYRRISFLKEKNYVQRVGTTDGKAIWALTPLGAEIHKRMKAYISRNSNK